MSEFKNVNRDLRFNEEYNEWLSDNEMREEFKKDYMDEVGVNPSDEELTVYMVDTICDFSPQVSSTDSFNDSPFSKVFGWLFVAWFIASFIGMFYFFATDPNIGFMIFGQYFLVFGIIALFNKISIGALFALVGTAIIVVPILINKPDLLPFEINWEFLGVFMFGVITFVIGVALCFSSYFANRKLKKRCNATVSARIIKMVDEKKMCPIYEYEYNGKKRKVKGLPINDGYVDQVVTLMINPNKPREIYFEFKLKDNLFMIVFGFPFVLAGLYLLIVSFFT